MNASTFQRSYIKKYKVRHKFGPYVFGHYTNDGCQHFRRKRSAVIHFERRRKILKKMFFFFSVKRYSTHGTCSNAFRKKLIAIANDCSKFCAIIHSRMHLIARPYRMNFGGKTMADHKNYTIRRIRILSHHYNPLLDPFKR